MSNITITLTQDQAAYTASILEQDINSDYPMNNQINAFTKRIINKINAELIK